MKIEKVNGKVKAKVEDDGFGVEFFTMRNGSQWTGQPMSPELARLSIEVLKEYLDSIQSVNDDRS